MSFFREYDSFFEIGLCQFSYDIVSKISKILVRSLRYDVFDRETDRPHHIGLKSKIDLDNSIGTCPTKNPFL